MFLYALTPLEAWLALSISSLIPTAVLYLVLNRVVQENFATLRGTISGFAVELGGPVAFYSFLLILPAYMYISPYAEVTLKGHVNDVDAQQLKGYEIAVVQRVSADEEFELKVPADPNNSYSFLVVNSGVPHLIGPQVVEDSKNIVLQGFPDEKRTKIMGENLKDQHDNPLPDEYTLLIAPIVRPSPAPLREGNTEVNIEHRAYKAVFHDSNKKIRAEEFLTDVLPGSRYPLPNPINIRLED